MNRTVQIVLLCEDTQHEVFGRRFLNKMGWSTRRMRVEKGSGRGGSAEHFVRERFPIELAAYRSKRGSVEQALIVIIDGDNHGVKKRLRDLDASCRAKVGTARQVDERVAIFVPTWQIETWFEYLVRNAFDESKSTIISGERESASDMWMPSLKCVVPENSKPPRLPRSRSPVTNSTCESRRPEPDAA